MIVAAFGNVMELTMQASAERFPSPIKVFDYGAMGNPVVAPEIGPMREVYIHGEACRIA